MKIEALETIKSDGYTLEQGDRLSIPDDVARRWCLSGWAKAMGGECRTGERRVNASVVRPITGTHTQAAEETN